MIEDEMESIVLSRAWEAFNGYGLDAEDDNKELTLVKHIDIGEGLKVGCLCWGSQDSAVVLSVVEDHSDWCEHGARLETVRVDRRGDLRDEEPSLLVTVPSCVTSLQTSPINAALLAAGCHTGDVFIYRTDREPSEAEVMSSIRQGDTDNLHPVVALLWLSRTSLMSVHSSGLLQLFSFDIRKSQLELKKTFLITATHLPRSLKPLRSGEVGLVHGAVSEDDPNKVIVSTEAGCVIMTDLNSELSLHSMETNKTLYDPVVSVYQLHTGTISAMALSPYDDNILATAGEDLRLLLVAVTSPQTAALSYQLDSPVSSLSWSPTRPSVLAAATNRFVLLFDTIQVMKLFRKIFQTVHHGQVKTGPILKIRHTERTISQPILTCAFPSKVIKFLILPKKNSVHFCFVFMKVTLSNAKDYPSCSYMS